MTSESVLVDDPMTRMVGGTHYTGFAIQPFEFAMANRWDAASFSTLKYVSRYRVKKGVIDLEKGRHCVEIRAKFISFTHPSWWDLLWIIKEARVPLRGFTEHDPERQIIPMARYVDANEINYEDAVVLHALDSYVRGSAGPKTVIAQIERLIELYQDEQNSVLR